MKMKDWILSSFDTTTKGGASARKLSAFWVILLVTLLHMRYLHSEFKTNGDFSLLPYVLIIDYLFMGLCLGLTTMEQIIKLKNGNTDAANKSDIPINESEKPA